MIETGTQRVIVRIEKGKRRLFGPAMVTMCWTGVVKISLAVLKVILVKLPKERKQKKRKEKDMEGR